MIELSLYLPKREIRYVLWIGYGSKFYGQIDFISFVKETVIDGKVEYGKMLFHT